MTINLPPLWRKIQKENFTRWEKLADFLELSQEVRAHLALRPRFSLNLPRRLAEKIQKNILDDPILKQFVPLQEELLETPGFVAEPLQDTNFRKTKKILHKYQGRALLLATSACAMHCRFCFRKNFPYETEVHDFTEDLNYIAQEKTLNEIILSGGDPLSLSDSQLDTLFQAFDTMPHIERIRFHTRFPIGIPERIDVSFLHTLKKSNKQIIFIIHCNHPRELDRDILAALKKIQKLGIPVLNQSVLLKGVNDDEQTLLELSETLVKGGILPYYLHVLDLVEGSAHFFVTDARAQELIQYLNHHTSGYAVPRLVRELPGHLSKQTLC
jgi:EF-P beta-lysylation protein EpmB